MPRNGPVFKTTMPSSKGHLNEAHFWRCWQKRGNSIFMPRKTGYSCQPILHSHKHWASHRIAVVLSRITRSGSSKTCGVCNEALTTLTHGAATQKP